MTTSYTRTRLSPCHMTVLRDITFQKFQCTSTTSRDNVNALTLSSSSYKKKKRGQERLMNT